MLQVIVKDCKTDMQYDKLIKYERKDVELENGKECAVDSCLEALSRERQLGAKVVGNHTLAIYKSSLGMTPLCSAVIKQRQHQSNRDLS
jgi:hypothetical protein